MLNPSTADANKSDPTITRCIGFSKLWGFGGIYVVNLYALRTPYPKTLFEALYRYNAKGPDNDHYIQKAAYDNSNARAVMAWGANVYRDPNMLAQADRITNMIREAGLKPQCLSITKNGQPRHPLMVPYSQQLEIYV
ncbi:unnamed protein product [marine sediment metagenome]|uniref:Uncharacterized protein n=1 Tax=marine sediment metagenome TaxID=412755 RepID=X1CUN4_9ZZZZ